MKPLMASVSGVRGIVGESLTPELVTRYSAAFGTLCKGGTVVTGRDTRVSGPMIGHAVTAGLLATGCSVIPLDICTTPTLQLAVPHFQASGGIVITASHNPAAWNALKFMDNEGKFLNAEKSKNLQDLIDRNELAYTTSFKVGAVRNQENFNNEHIKAVLCSEFIKLELIRRKNFKIVVDCVNGAASTIIPELLEELGCDVVKMNCEPDGKFPRGAEPIPANITDICSKVTECNADIGFAFDPDGDRLAVVDENGNPLGEENTLVIASTTILEQRPGPIAANISTTSALNDLAERYNVDIYRSAVGEAHVVRAMMEHKCIVGGEGNGGVILPDVHLGRDALVGAALVLQLCGQRQKPLSAIAAEYPRYYMTKVKVDVENRDVGALLHEIQQNTGGARIDTTDGLKLVFPAYWVHLRPSNTEPVIRVIVESQSLEKSNEIAAGYLSRIVENE